MSKRGLSMEEKKAKMVEIFHESFYSLKELEKIAPKSKGIVVQSVKEVLDDLCSDGFVIMDKIRRVGARHLIDDLDYWSLPSAAGAVKNAALSKATRELEKTEVAILETEKLLAASQVGREDTDERRRLLSMLEEELDNASKLQTELAAFGAADPVKYENKKECVEVCREGAMRWTDNVLMLIQYAASVGGESVMIRGMLGIDDEWEDL
ncbi:uncharacterized protein L203_102350 [Cryptococcus depauperatus CBS 7841]|uniref:Meiotic nuclear division protein 1 n=1 Tax=Cryptococcus depauperatus CBS 7841 TaxID=1295531 RepID=A0AAJ8JRP5_9TREE